MLGRLSPVMRQNRMVHRQHQFQLLDQYQLYLLLPKRSTIGHIHTEASDRRTQSPNEAYRGTEAGDRCDCSGLR